MERLIIADDVRKYCVAKAKLDTARYEPFIESAELNYIKPFLGDDYYDEIVTQYTADPVNYSADNIFLVNTYLKKALSWFVLADALPFINIEITNSGLQRNNSEFSTSGTQSERADLVTSARFTGNVFLTEAKKYIEKTQQADSSKFPLYHRYTNIDNAIQIKGGMIFDTDDDFDDRHHNRRD